MPTLSQQASMPGGSICGFKHGRPKFDARCVQQTGNMYAGAFGTAAREQGTYVHAQTDPASGANWQHHAIDVPFCLATSSRLKLNRKWAARRHLFKEECSCTTCYMLSILLGSTGECALVYAMRQLLLGMQNA